GRRTQRERHDVARGAGVGRPVAAGRAVAERGAFGAAAAGVLPDRRRLDAEDQRACVGPGDAADEQRPDADPTAHQSNDPTGDADAPWTTRRARPPLGVRIQMAAPAARSAPPATNAIVEIVARREASSADA